MIEYLSEGWQLFLQCPEWAILFWSFCLVKAFGNALKHNYLKFKRALGIPNKWDWWFDPSISWTNKYKKDEAGVLIADKDGNLIKKSFHLTPLTDFWHSIWTLWQFAFIIVVSLKTSNWIYGVGIVGVVGVFLIFNGFYNWLKQTKFIHWL